MVKDSWKDRTNPLAMAIYLTILIALVAADSIGRLTQKKG